MKGYVDFGLLVVFCAVCAVYAHPTMYKLNDNKKLEPDLIPVSSTVIPIPVYKVSYGVQVGKEKNSDKIEKPEGPFTLVTVHSKKKPISLDKQKNTEVPHAKKIAMEKPDN